MTIVYDSFEGRYSDSPRALYERARQWHPQLEQIWICHPDHAATFPADAVTVPTRSAEAVAALEAADLVVGSTHIELEWQKKPGGLYLQTWHGTPLKRIHRDSLWAPPGVVDRLDRDVARWDYLLSPNALSTPRLQRAFGFRGEVLETGYPRNDVLSSPAAPAVRARVREELGIPPEATAVLYAPTWRDREFYADEVAPVELALDVEAFSRTLGPDHLLLTRLHPKMTDRVGLLEAPQLVEVSRHADVHELYLAADVLVTDYSSVMFDFAITGKPMVFFAYDLAAYRDTLRGFYFDLEPLAPGPVLGTSAEVIAALGDLDGVRASYAERYTEFQRSFTYLEDGHAADRLRWLFDRAAGQAGPGAG